MSMTQAFAAAIAEANALNDAQTADRFNRTVFLRHSDGSVFVLNGAYTVLVGKGCFLAVLTEHHGVLVFDNEEVDQVWSSSEDLNVDVW